MSTEIGTSNDLVSSRSYWSSPTWLYPFILSRLLLSYVIVIQQQVVAVLRLNISVKMQSESCLGNLEINVGPNVDSEGDFFNDS